MSIEQSTSWSEKLHTWIPENVHALQTHVADSVEHLCHIPVSSDSGENEKKLLLEKIAQGFLETWEDWFQKKGQMIHDLILNTGDINIAFDDGRNGKQLTPLMVAPTPELVRLILSHPDVNVNKQALDWLTALMRFSRGWSTERFDLVLEHPDTDVNIVSVNWFTALMIAGQHPYFKKLLNDPRMDFHIVDQGDKAYALAWLGWWSDAIREAMEKQWIKINPIVGVESPGFGTI